MLLPVVALLALAGDLEFTAPLTSARYGRIIIEGNTDTPDRVILDRTAFQPGKRIAFGEVGAARESLRACGVFKSNPWRGEGPTVQFLRNELGDTYLDVFVRIEERPGNWIAFGLAELLESGVLAAVTLDSDPFLRDLSWFGRRAAQQLRP